MYEGELDEKVRCFLLVVMFEGVKAWEGDISSSEWR